MTDYEAARIAHNEAYAKYEKAVESFRAGGSFEEFAAAQAEKKEADEAFDIAFEIASNLPAEELAETENDSQFEMFA